MKKIAVFILALVYLGTASGATVNIHYCMGKYAGWDLGNAEAGHCGTCGMDKSSFTNDPCCKDEQKNIKVNDVHKSAVIFAELMQVPASENPQPFTSLSTPVSSITETYPVINAPPGIAGQDTFLYIRSIRI